MQISFKPGTSFIYSLNPMIKGALAFSAIMFFSINSFPVWVMALVMGFLFLPAAITRVPLADIVLSLKRIWILLLFVALIQGFRDGSFNSIHAIDGIIRILGVFFAAGLYVTISSQSELMYFWEICFRPFALLGLPASELALVMVIAVRFFPVILGEIERIRMAQIARGARLGGGGLLDSASSLMPLLIPTLTQAIIRAGDLAQAMEARGYNINANRSRYCAYRLGKIDFFLGILPLCLVMAAIYSRF